VVLFALPAAAQFTRDAAATRKIDEAINTHYLATDFDKAEAVLTGTIKACEDKCSPQTLAKAWMYVGIVRGSGRNDQGGAKEAFKSALGLDPSVKLDAGLATPETQATFGQSGGGGAVETPTTPAASAPAAPAAAAGSEGNGLICTPAVTEVETRRPIPVQCKSDEAVTSVELRYKPFGEDTWKTLKMERKGKSFRGQIPCDATQTAGTLKLYVNGKDTQGEAIVTWGNKTQPIEIQLAEQSSEEPPSFDDADAPARCAAKEICPPDFPGCDSGKGGGTLDWGAACNNSTECKSGLLCMDGTCETAPSCTTTSDCPAGTCVDGKCAVSPGEDGSSGMVGPPKKWWVGLHVAQDFAFVGGDNVCTAESQANDNFACYFPGSRDIPYDPGHYGTTAVGKIGTGTVMATTRFMLSLDRLITPHIMAGVRLGYAIRGGPPAKRQVEYDGDESFSKVLNEGKAFLPFHAEVRGSYWFGQNALSKRGFRPYVHAGGGLAQVDAKVVVNTHEECSKRVPAANPACGTPDPRTGDYSADAWKKLGQGFITIGGGLGYAFTSKMMAQVNVNAMYMLGASGLVLQPSLGVAMGL
jgi:hypothetical protein